MGQKVNPHGMRVGVINDWDSKWFAEKDYAALLVEDAKIRQFLKKHLFVAGISKIGIKRVGTRIKLPFTQLSRAWSLARRHRY